MNRSTPRRRRPAVGTALGATFALALTFALAACGSDDGDGESAGGKVNLTIATFNEFGYEDLIDEWNAANPDIQVDQKKVGTWDDAKDNLYTKLAAGSGLSDIEAIEGDAMPAILAESDAFVDLTDPELDGPLARLQGRGRHRRRRPDDRLRHRRRARGHLLPRRPVREGRSADRPRGGRGADGHLGRLLRHRRGVRQEGARHRVVRLHGRHRPGDAQPGREPLRAVRQHHRRREPRARGASTTR